MVYINGRKASKKDFKMLVQWIKDGKTTATAHTTKGGSLAIVTSC